MLGYGFSRDLKPTVLRLRSGRRLQPALDPEQRIRIGRQQTRGPAIALVRHARVAQCEYLPVIRVGDGAVHRVQNVGFGSRHARSHTT